VYSEKLLVMDRGTIRKNIEFYSKNKFEELEHLVGFIIRIYHDAWSPEGQGSSAHTSLLREKYRVLFQK